MSPMLYHKLREPFTSVRTEVLGGHTTLHIWVNHGKAGEIVLRNEEVPGVLMAISKQELNENWCAAVVDVAGVHVNESVNYCAGYNECLVSDRGDLSTIAELKRSRGEWCERK